MVTVTLGGQMERATIERITFATLAGITLGVVNTTAVTLDVWIINDTAANLIAGLYVAVLAAVAIDPRRVILHQAAMPLGVLFWSSRAIVALRLIDDGAATTVWTVFYTAVGLGTLATALHMLAVRSSAAFNSTGRTHDR